MKKALFCFTLIFACCFSHLHSQNQAKKWHFGTGCALDFMTNPPTVLTGMLNTWEGSSSIADANGNLLFYTDGITVYNQNNVIMANGTGLMGDGSSTQCGVIVKQPGNNTLYYIFTNAAQGASNGFRYSIVDMSLAGGTGSVITKNILLNTPNTEKVTSVKHCNGTDVWVVSHDCGSNNFRAYLITASGISPSATLSPVGTSNDCGGSGTIGYLKASPSGRKLATALHGQGLFELYDFDNSTGVVSNQLVLANVTMAYGVEFSPDGTKLYGTREGFGDGNTIYQWNLCAGSPAAIVASQYSFSTMPNVSLYALQVATNGKIYVARFNEQDIGVINNPNVYGPGCNFVDLGQSVAPNTCRIGLPNFISSLLRVPQPFTYTIGCLNVNFLAASNPTAGNTCTAASYPATSWQWDFGDPPSGPANTSTLSNPVHTYTNGGTYTVQLITNYACQGLTDTVKASITVNSSNLVVNTAPTTTQASCTNSNNAFNINLNFLPANPVPNYTVTWSPTPNGIVNNTQTAVAGNIAPGSYNATITTTGGCYVTTGFVIDPIPTIANFTAAPNTVSVTCSNTQVPINLSPNTYTYSWVSINQPSLTGSSNNFNGGTAGIYTVTSFNGIADCSTSQTVAIGQNTIAPTNTVNPVSQAVTCNSGSPVTFSGTVSSPTVNVQHDWYSPLNPLPGGVPIATSNNTISILSGEIPPGVYTLQTTNLVNGCKTSKTITITSLSAFPTFSMSSPTNFSVGCAPLNQTTLSIINPVSTQTPPSTCSFTFLPPGFGGVVTPSIVLDPNNSSTITATPGTWTIIVQDNSNFCRTSIAVPVIQNTFAPDVSATALTQTLTCYHPTVIAVGTSSTPNTIITWNVPSTPPTLSTPSVVIGDIANGPATNTTALNYATFTVVATNSLNACQSISVVTINQNFKPPVSLPQISIATPTAIYCTVANAPVVLSAGASTTTSGGGPTAFPVVVLWQGPSPQPSMTAGSNYSCYVPGIYSLTIMDNYNGCSKTGTVNVVDRTQPPVLMRPADTSTLDCGSDFARLIADINGPKDNLRYWFYGYPVGASFSPSNAISPSGTNSSTVQVSLSGLYQYIVTNTLTGCASVGGFDVDLGNLTSGLVAEPANGYAPLNVTFTNNTTTGQTTSGINSIWSFGNGTSQQTSSINVSPSVTYTAPGTYTVWLTTSKGTCLDSTFQIITVDIPSKLEVPNVFTPNGDGSNDVFFLKVANIVEIHAIIFDRWGNKVYETTSGTGNIAWDGTNFQGKNCAAGVYFYVITGKGKDDVEYSSKGNISLFR